MYRVAKLGGGRMPRAGSTEIDARGLRLLRDWIIAMPPLSPDTPRATATRVAAGITSDLKLVLDVRTRPAAVERLVASTRGALALSQIMDSLPAESRRQIVAVTSKHGAIEVRDLFERFVPADKRIKRLGNVVNQSQILSLESDAERGHKVFFSDAAASCKNCHRVGKTGENLGPDLSAIGKKYRRDQLLLHILEPSRFMEPKYVPYLVETKQGLVFSGLLDKKTDSEVVLKDARNKRTVIAAEDVEVIVRQQKSLMPDLLLRDMTAAQVADLLAYLATLR
jgi:putative heme-binding domain-containing protein